MKEHVEVQQIRKWRSSESRPKVRLKSWWDDQVMMWRLCDWGNDGE